jgi:hypothetical protein
MIDSFESHLNDMNAPSYFTLQNWANATFIYSHCAAIKGSLLPVKRERIDVQFNGFRQHCGLSTMKHH